MSSLLLSGFLRIVTHPKVFCRPTPLRTALKFIEDLCATDLCVRVFPGPRHWDIFTRLCTAVSARGNRIPDAYHAALAIESGCELITADRGFARFPELKWEHPFGRGVDLDGIQDRRPASDPEHL